jgi:hypothetical protein
MADLSFEQQLALTIFDKLVLAGIAAYAIYKFNRLLEAFKSERAGQLEAFKNELTIKGEKEKTIRQAAADLAKKIAGWVTSYMLAMLVRQEINRAINSLYYSRNVRNI